MLVNCISSVLRLWRIIAKLPRGKKNIYMRWFFLLRHLFLISLPLDLPDNQPMASEPSATDVICFLISNLFSFNSFSLHFPLLPHLPDSSHTFSVSTACSLTVHSDNRVTQVGGLSKWDGDLSLILLPSPLRLPYFVRTEGMLSPGLLDLPKSCAADRQPFSLSKAATFPPTKGCLGLMPAHWTL